MGAGWVRGWMNDRIDERENGWVEGLESGLMGAGEDGQFGG